MILLIKLKKNRPIVQIINTATRAIILSISMTTEIGKIGFAASAERIQNTNIFFKWCPDYMLLFSIYPCQMSH